jgi:hypothetical protein
MPKEIKTAEEIARHAGILSFKEKSFDRRVLEAMEDYAHQFKVEVSDEDIEQIRTLAKEANDLMEFCIDRKYLDNEDLTDGQISFNQALENIRNLIVKLSKPL